MTDEERKQMLREKYLEEIRQEGPDLWFYVSVVDTAVDIEQKPDGVFIGGYYFLAKGDLDARVKVGGFGWSPKGTEVLIVGPIDSETMAKIPVEKRWRRLSREEVKEKIT